MIRTYNYPEWHNVVVRVLQRYRVNVTEAWSGPDDVSDEKNEIYHNADYSDICFDNSSTGNPITLSSG